MAHVPHDDDRLLQRPVLILGAPRSGTTFLGRVLGRHTAVSYVVEPRTIWKYGNERRSDMLGADDARPEVVRYVRQQMARVVREGKGERLLEKTPANALRMGFIDRIFPDCRFIHIRRSGPDAILSIHHNWRKHVTGEGDAKERREWWRTRLKVRLGQLDWRRAPFYAGEFVRWAAPDRLASLAGFKSWGPHLPGLDAMIREMDLLEVCALQWRTCVEAACHYGRQLPPERYIECRLEDLGEDLIRKLLRFADLDEDDEAVWSTFHERFRPHLAGARSARAPEDELAMIERWIEPTTTWLE